MSKLDLTDNQVMDYKKYYIEGGEIGFSPERNKYIVEKTIKDYEEKQKEKDKQFVKELEWRSEAAVSWAKHLDKGNTTPAEKYFGHKVLSELQGRNIMNEIKARVVRQNIRNGVNINQKHSNYMEDVY